MPLSTPSSRNPRAHASLTFVWFVRTRVIFAADAMAMISAAMRASAEGTSTRHPSPDPPVGSRSPHVRQMGWTHAPSASASATPTRSGTSGRGSRAARAVVSAGRRLHVAEPGLKLKTWLQKFWYALIPASAICASSAG